MSAITQSETGQILFLRQTVKFWIVIATTLAVFAILLWFFLNNALVRVSVTYENQVKRDEFLLTYSVESSQPTPEVSFVFGDYAFVPRDIKTLQAQTINAQTIVSAGKLPWWSVPHYIVTLKPQREIQKIAGQTLGCTYMSPQGTFSYTCSSLASIIKINQPTDGPWDITPQFETDATAFARYKEGFLALTFPVPEATSSGSARIDYLVPGRGNSPIKSFPLPRDFAQSNDDNLLMFTDQSGQNPGAVIANTTTGEFVYIKNIERPADITRFKRKAAKSEEELEATFCALNSSKLACFYGPIGDHEHMGEFGEEPDILPATAEMFDLASPDTSTVTKTDVSNVESIYLTPGGNIFAFDPKNGLLYELTYEGNDLKHRVVATDVVDVTASNSVHFISNQKIYEYLPGQAASYLRYTSDRLRLSGITSYGDTTVLDAFIEYGDDAADSSETHGYLLTNTPAATDAKRTEDYLPYSPLSELGFAYMDYNQKYIYVALEPVFSTDPTTGIQSVNATATEQKKAYILDKLTRDGLAKNREVLFYAGGM